MSGPIARRRSPRIGSLTFRRLWWVLVRETALRVLYPWVAESSRDVHQRAFLSRSRTDHIRLAVERALASAPERALFPPRRNNSVESSSTPGV
jgi:hypothetical protein